MSQEKLDQLGAMVTEFQQKLAAFEVPARNLGALAILSDLLTAVDIASRDIYWAKKDLVEDNIYEIGEKK